MGCGCGSGEGLSWEEFERILRDIEEADTDPDEAPIEVTEEDVFSPVRKTEEVEADR
jgi:hypothetical protein